MDLTKMKSPTLLICLSLSILISACSSNPVSVSMSTTRFDSPEVSSEPLRVNLAAGIGSRTTVVIEEKYNDNAYDGSELYDIYRGNITAAKGLEVSLRGDGDSATRIGVKYQFYGAHTEQSIKGNIAQAFTLGYEKNSTSKQHLEDSYSDYSTNNGDWEHDTNVYDIAWVIGYRFAKRDIIYGGPFYQWGQLNGYKTIPDEAQIKLNSDGHMIGANIVIEHRFSFGMGLAGEVVYANLNWDNYSHTDTSFNFKIDYQF